MSQIQAKQLLKVEDFPKETRTWLSGMFYIINRFINQAIQAVNGNLEFGVNILGQEHEFNFEYVSDSVSLPLSVNYRLSKPPRSVVVVYATEDGTPVPILLNWRNTQDQGILFENVYRITTAPAVSALNATSRYVIRVRITP